MLCYMVAGMLHSSIMMCYMVASEVARRALCYIIWWQGVHTSNMVSYIVAGEVALQNYVVVG